MSQAFTFHHYPLRGSPGFLTWQSTSDRLCKKKSKVTKENEVLFMDRNVKCSQRNTNTQLQKSDDVTGCTSLNARLCCCFFRKSKSRWHKNQSWISEDFLLLGYCLFCWFLGNGNRAGFSMSHTEQQEKQKTKMKLHSIAFLP